MDGEIQNEISLRVQKANMTEAQRRSCYEFLLAQSTNGTLKKGSITSASHRFGFTTQTISSVWARGKTSISMETTLQMYYLIFKEIRDERGRRLMWLLSKIFR